MTDKPMPTSKEYVFRPILLLLGVGLLFTETWPVGVACLLLTVIRRAKASP